MGPTVLYGCHSSITIVQKEVFGPCTIAILFKDETDAISRAVTHRDNYGALKSDSL